MSTVLLAIAVGLLAILVVRSYFPTPQIAPDLPVRAQQNPTPIVTDASSVTRQADPQSGSQSGVPQRQDKLASLSAEEKSLLGQAAALRNTVAQLRAELGEVRAQTNTMHSQAANLQKPQETQLQSASASKALAPSKPTSLVARTTTHVSKDSRSAGPAGSKHSVREFLLLARDQLAIGHVNRTMGALDSAETKALNNNAAYRGEQDPTKSRLVQRIEDARDALGMGNRDEALDLIKLALSGVRATR